MDVSGALESVELGVLLLAVSIPLVLVAVAYAVMLIRAAVALGALSAPHIDAARLAQLDAYARAIRLAFQITDDLLDYSGNPATTGKDAGLDRNRTTFVNLCGIDGARRLADELISSSIAALAPFGRRAELLAGLADMIRERDR